MIQFNIALVLLVEDFTIYIIMAIPFFPISTSHLQGLKKSDCRELVGHRKRYFFLFFNGRGGKYYFSPTFHPPVNNVWTLKKRFLTTMVKIGSRSFGPAQKSGLHCYDCQFFLALVWSIEPTLIYETIYFCRHYFL